MTKAGWVLHNNYSKGNKSQQFPDAYDVQGRDRHSSLNLCNSPGMDVLSFPPFCR